MEIQINNDRTFLELQQDFGHLFPYLKIEFFFTPFSRNQLPSAKNMIPTGRKIGSVRKHEDAGNLMIHDTMTVYQVEEKLDKDFGLFGQIFRRSGNLWIGTLLTGHWTLNRQNLEGYEISQTLSKQTFADSIVNDTEE